jgi:hypothetical protein
VGYGQVQLYIHLILLANPNIKVKEDVPVIVALV